MSNDIGILFGLIALLSWGFGDFFIQRTTRVVGSRGALFFVGIFGFVGLFPFVKNNLSSLDPGNFLLLGVLGVIVVFATFFDFEALKQGKIAIVEPIIGLELPMTVGLSIFLANESISLLQLLLIGVVFIGIMLAITTQYKHLHYHKRIFEKGVVLALVGSIGMALTNFFVGISSQSISPLITIWFVHTLLAVVFGIYIFSKGEFKNLISSFRKHPKLVIGQSVLDNVGWVSFASATTYIPIAIATTISEGYIILAVLLGIFINKEKLRTTQLVGVVIATTGVVVLAYFS